MSRGGSRHLRRAAVILAVGFAIAFGCTSAFGSSAFAAGAPPAHVTPAQTGGVDTLHGAVSKFASGVTRTRPTRTQQGANPDFPIDPGGGNPVYITDPILFVHGFSPGGQTGCKGFSNTISYLQNWHPGLGSDDLFATGPFVKLGYYNNYTSDSCNILLMSWAGWPGVQNCDNYPNGFRNSDSRVGTINEPIEHVACELAWYIYNNYSYKGQNVKIVSHSMGGLVVRKMIQMIGQPHFPSQLYVSDVVTFSSPHGGINYAQAFAGEVYCTGASLGFCYQTAEMLWDNNTGNKSAFMQDIYNHDHPNATNGTDWTMMGSLSNNDFLDWQWQATYMSSSPTGKNHRLGYYDVPACSGQPGWPGGYGHGNYMDDMCDGYDASYYYCDGCSRDRTSFYSTRGAPHSLHNMLFAFTYYNW